MFGKAKAQLARKGRTSTAGAAVARFDSCKFGGVKFDGNLLHRSWHDSRR